ncbi:MAG: hypothetical protein NUV96_00510 [Candidatus Colwellbacteria bacterium]|nr:hypothetical protein [Candidatus Colwellbacteria bacterium]
MKQNIVDRVAGAVEDALEVRSEQYELNFRDFWEVSKTGLSLLLAAFIANIDLFREQLAAWGVNQFWVAIAVFVVLELGRKFAQDNK